MKRFLFLLIFISLISQTIQVQNGPVRDGRTNGWQEPRLGMFTH